MAATSAPVYDGLPSSVDIGYQTEQYSRTRTFDVTAMLEEMPGAAVALVVLRPKETEAYIADTEISGATLTWTISPADTAVPGRGSCQVMLTDSSDPTKILLSQVIPVTVNASIVEGDEEPPEPYEPWMAGIAERLAEIEALAQTTYSITTSGTSLVIATVNAPEGGT